MGAGNAPPRARPLSVSWAASSAPSSAVEAAAGWVVTNAIPRVQGCRFLSLRARIVHSLEAGVGTNRRGPVVLWSRHAMQSRERDALEKLTLHVAQALNPNAVRPAGPQTSSRRGQPSGWLQTQRPCRKPGGRPVFWKLCSDRRVRLGWCRCGTCGRLWTGPNGRRANRSRELARPSGTVSRGLRGSSRRLCSRGALAGVFSALIPSSRSTVRSVRLYQAAVPCFDARAQLNPVQTPQA
jgi:hypothetical protein